jgi:hypothetical protein
MINEGFQLAVYELEGFWRDIAFQSDLGEVRHFVASQQPGKV